MSTADIKWELQRLDGIKYLIRNVSTVEAHSVIITSNDDYVSRASGGTTVYPGGAIVFDVNSAPEDDVQLTIAWESRSGDKQVLEIAIQ